MICSAFLVTLCLLTATLSADPPVVVQLLDGSSIEGKLARFNHEQLTVETSGGKQDVATNRLLSIQVADKKPQDITTVPLAVAIRGGGLLLAKDLTTNNLEATVTLLDKQPVTLRLDGIAGMLFSPITNESLEHWRTECAKERTSDLLVADRSGEKAELEGIIGNIGKERLSFTVDGEAVDVRRDRVRSLYFATSPIAAKSPVTLHEVGGNIWPASKILWDDTGVTIMGVSIGSQQRTAETVARIDVASDRITYLSDLKPDNVEHIPYFDTTWPVQKDRNLFNKPIQLGTTRFAKGIVVHSKTTLTYEIAGQYKQFLATVGIEGNAGPLGQADVRFVADGKVVKDLTVRANETSFPVDIPLEQVQQLSIIVDYGPLADLGDHVAFADARLVK